jgi:hypothetical protein
MLYFLRYNGMQPKRIVLRFWNTVMIDDRKSASLVKRYVRLCLAALLAGSANLIVSDARAQDAFGETSPSFFFGSPAEPAAPPRPRVYIWSHSPRHTLQSIASSTNSFCVRTCDGRFFPVPKVSDVSDVKACEAVCPATEMQVYSGSDIDNATTERGLAYNKLVNAFRFRREMVASCTCNARDRVGLTRVSIEDDSTVRSGDLVAQENGFAIASEGGSGHRRMMFRPLSQAKARALGLTRISSR